MRATRHAARTGVLPALVAVADITTARAVLLHDAGIHTQQSATDLAGGRLLLFAPDETLSDGAAWVSSRGFFGSDNVPPWDTWVAYIEDIATDPQYGHPWFLGAYRDYQKITHQPMPLSYLVCWIPPCLLEVAEAGIDANPEECIVWLAARDTTFTRALQETGLQA